MYHILENSPRIKFSKFQKKSTKNLFGVIFWQKTIKKFFMDKFWYEKDGTNFYGWFFEQSQQKKIFRVIISEKNGKIVSKNGEIPLFLSNYTKENAKIT